MKKKDKRVFYIVYSLFFLFIAGVTVFIFYSRGKAMIDENGDGFRQHFIALVYYSKYLREIISNFLHGNFVIPRWDFAIGEGADILLNFHLYSIGDIFTFLSFLCPEKYMYLYYDGITLARMYCSGLAFSSLCFYKEKNNISAVLVGSLLYAFSAYSISSMSNHVYFIAATVYLPLIILGIEKIIAGDKPYFLVIVVALASLSNFYFFFMNVVSTAIYVVIRLIFLKKENKDKLKLFATIALYSSLGLLISSIIFLPFLVTMLNNSRVNSPVQYNLLFALNTYISYFKSLTFHGSYFGGFSFLWSIALSYLFVIKKNNTLIALFVVAMLFINLPTLSSIYHAFAYPTDRWVYAVTLIVAYIIVECLQEINKINSLFVVNVVVACLYYGACILLDSADILLHTALLFMTVFFIIFVKYCKSEKINNILCVLMIVFFLGSKMYYLFGERYWNYARYGTDIDYIEEKASGEKVVFDQINDDSFFRYSGAKLSDNTVVLGDISSTQHYWTIVNDYIVDFRGQLGYSDSSLHHFFNYGERFAQNALSCVKYYVNKDENSIPYGFDFIGNIRGYDVYKSNYALDLIYAYDNYVLQDEWNRYNPIDKNEIMAHAAFVDKDISNISSRPVNLENKEIAYEMILRDGIEVTQTNIHSTGTPDSIIELHTSSDLPGEYHVEVLDLSSNKLTAYIKVNYNDVSKTFIFKGTENMHNTDRHDYIVDLGYFENIDGVITIDFSSGGDYLYDSIKVICQPLDSQIAALNNLRKVNINNLLVNNNRIDADVSVDENKLLCIAVPYSKGWRAYIDGKRVDVLNCNIQYMAVEMPVGNHHLQLKYNTPFLSIACILSLIGILLLSYLIYKDRMLKQVRCKTFI